MTRRRFFIVRAFVPSEDEKHIRARRRVMASAELSHDFGLTRGPLLRWIAFAALAAVVIFVLGSRLHDALRQGPAAGSIEASGVSPAHCAQFIELAKATFGPDWRHRLDPRDTTCANAIQEQWQSERYARPPIQPEMPPTMPILPTTTGSPSTPAVTDSRIRSPETYCLNVISLARSKYGPDWASQISPEEAARCAEAIRSVGGQ
jgi:hypothetical protein